MLPAVRDGGTSQVVTRGHNVVDLTTIVKAVPVPAVVPQIAAPSVSRETTETLYWQGALTANTEPAFRLYLKQYPSGTFAELAKQNLGRFAAVPKVQVQAKPVVPSSSAAFVGAASAMPNLGAAFSAPTGQVSAGAGAAAAQRFAFAPSAALRKHHTAEFFQAMRSGGNVQMANVLETAFASQDTFAGLDKVISVYGLKSNNLADSLTVFLDTLREAANGKDENVTRKQALAVRDQMALILLASPETASLTDPKKQELADALILNTLVVAAAFEAAKAGDPSVRRELADQIQAMVKTSLGIDLRAVRLTDEGYRL